MNRYLDKLKSMIAQSSLSRDEQQDFITALSQADDSVLQPVVDLCSEDIEWINNLYANYRLKRSAHVAQDAQAWDGILKEEERLLGGIKK